MVIQTRVHSEKYIEKISGWSNNCHLLVLKHELKSHATIRPSDRVRKILGNYAEFPGGHILRQKRFIMRQIMRFLWRRFLIEHVLSWDSQQRWRFHRLCMVFPMLNSLKLEFYVCYFGQLMHFLSIKRFLIDDAIGYDSRSIVRALYNCNVAQVSLKV